MMMDQLICLWAVQFSDTQMFSAYVSSVTQLSLNLRDLARSEPQKSEELAKLGIISFAEGFAKAMFHSRAKTELSLHKIKESSKG